jgi:TonB-linked SusC/RagA family outer membrane protein
MRKVLSFTAMLICITLSSIAQTRLVTGRIIDDFGVPVSGASIKIRGLGVGASADDKGNFKINAKTGDVLQVTALNFSTAETKLNSQNSVDIRLLATATKLSEVIVTTALGLQRQAKSLGYSTAKVSSTELVQAKPVSVVNGLTGKVSGLQINTVNNGLFAPSRVTLRGNRSLTGNNQPLIVVDGAIYYSDISTLNPEDVSDVTVLKGSSAAAVYGSDASNGVIIVTTKHGTRTKSSSLTFSSTVQAEKVSYLPAYQRRFGSNGGEVFVADFNDLSTYQPYENQSYGPEFNGKMVPLGRPGPDNSVFYVPYSSIKNQKRDFFNKGITTQHNLSFQSTEENGSFFLSLQDIVSKAVMPGDIGRRDIVRVGGNKRYGIFSASYSAAYTYKNSNTTETSAVYEDLTESPTHVPFSKLKDWQNNYFASPSGYYNDYYRSPYAVIGQERNYLDDHNVAANVMLNLKPFKWLNLSYRSSINNISARTEYKGSEIKYSTYALNDPRIVFSNADATGVDTSTAFGAKTIAVNDNPHPASYSTANFNNLLFSTDFLATVNTDVATDFNITATVGYSYLDNKVNYTPVGVNGGNSLTFPVYNTSVYSSAPSVLGQQVAQARKLGLFGEATLGYKEFAFLHGSYRTDIDSRLSRANRFIPYYDIDASVVLTDLFKSILENSVLNYAKIRFAHSLTGNVSPLANGSPYIAYGAYATEPAVNAASGFPYSASGLSGYSISTVIANPNIKPEKVVEDEIGLELSFLKDRITLNGSVYKAITTDGIVYAQISRATGAALSLINAAKTSNKGLELDLKTTVLRSRDVTWNVGVNYTHNISKVLAISGDVKQLGLAGSNGNAYAVVGQPYPVIQSYNFIKDSATGKVIVDPVTGNPKRSGQLSILGQANPKDIIGITSSVSWRNFSFSATADYRAGHKIFNRLGQTIDHSGVGLTTANTGRQRFVFPNSVYFDDTKGTYVENTNVTVDDANFNFWPSLYNGVGANYVVSAAAWKLREVVISYNFPKSWLSYSKVIKNASIALSGRNLIMIRPSTNKWTDPEFSEDTGNGVGRTGLGQAPPTRIFSANLSVTF